MKYITRTALLAILVLAPVSTGLRAQGPAGPTHPKLVVFVAVDQMRADYLVRYADLYQHGLKLLTEKGAWFTNAAYPYLNTVTCAGHSTLGTGTLPYKHGMVLNAWYDRNSGKMMTCTQDPSVKEVSFTDTPGIADSAKNVKQPSLAELMHRNKGQVVTMSIKPRSAIGLAGHHADSVIWFDEHGTWETSTAYGRTLPAWVTAFSKANPVDRDAGKVWDRTLPADRYQYADDAPGEALLAGWKNTFPHPLGNASEPGFYAHWLTSPFANEYLEQMAEEAIDTLKLGQQSSTDFLGVSFSALDSAGHAFGPRSHEVQDVLVRLDATIGKLLEHLDAKVGAQNYVLALSSDHGVADVPEQVPNAGRQKSEHIVEAIETALKPFFGDRQEVAVAAYTDIYLQQGIYDRLRDNAKAMAAVKSALLALPGIANVFRADDVNSRAARESTDPQIKAAALSYFAGRSGDLILIPKENWLLAPTATTHGTLYQYDQRVPVIFYGAAIAPGSRTDAATPADVAVTLGATIGVTLPSPDGQVLKSALR
jgi:predicted AlkP superfamily pyrophosphatase or phosphodiesterase